MSPSPVTGVIAAGPPSKNEEVFRDSGPSTKQKARQWWRQGRLWIICVAVFLALSLLAFLAQGSGTSSTETLSITNPAPAGAQAAAEVLRKQGVTVTALDSLKETSAALAANGDGNSTVLLHDPRKLLSAAQVADLVEAVQHHGARLVVITPGPLTVQALGNELSSAGSTTTTEVVAAGCEFPAALTAQKIDGGAPPPGLLAPVESSPQLYKGAQECFSPAGAGEGGYLALTGDGDMAVLGHPGIMQNQNLPRYGNAALTFGLLGTTPELLWYTASLEDVPVADQPPSLAEFTPPWIFPASLWLLLVALVGMFWKGRRHGPLVSEPLPVLVKSAETLAGRARLYQDARAAPTAARALQRATLTRLALVLRLGHTAHPTAVVEAASSATGRDRRQVEALLVGPPPQTDKELLTMAVELAALEEEVAQQ